MNKLFRNSMIGGASLAGMVLGHTAPACSFEDKPTDAANVSITADSASPPELQSQLDQLRRMIEQQNKVIEQLQKKLDEKQVGASDAVLLPASLTTGPGPRRESESPVELSRRLDEAIESFERDKEEAKRLTPTGVQTGYLKGNGFYIRSVPDPKWENWDGDKKIPFELRIRGRTQLDYYNFHIDGDTNHQTGRPFADAFGKTKNEPDFSALEVKRIRLIFEGHAFDPDLKYRVQLNGDTRGLPGLFNNNHISSGSPDTGGTSSVEGGGVTVDHAVRLFEGWVSYDLHGKPYCNECDDPCCPHVPNYRSTYSLIGGKLKLLGPIEEYLGSGNEQFVEFSAASWFFSPDDDNLAVAAGVQSKMLDDRLYWVAFITNGSESNFAANQIDNYPGFNIGGWYDFGGTWDESKKKWKLFGDSMSDIDTSENPVLRVGGAADFVPMHNRSLYGDAEQSRFRTADGGARVVDILNGAGDAKFAVDQFDAYIFNLFAATKYCGFSLSNEWWFRYLTDFDTVPTGNGVIKYKDGAGAVHTFDKNSLSDFGMQLQGGYFICPETLEAVARWSTIWGESGNVNGGFDSNEGSNEYTIGLNWFMHRHQLKVQTDVGYYEGGNSASASAAGFLANRDGWLFRSQIQLAF